MKRIAAFLLILSTLGFLVAFLVLEPCGRYVSSVVLREVSGDPSSDRLQRNINSIAQQILSRTVLREMIQRFNLYPEQLLALPWEDVVERCRKEDVKLSTDFHATRQFPGVHLTFRYRDHHRAQAAAQYLAGRFISEYSRSVEAEAESKRKTLADLAQQTPLGAKSGNVTPDGTRMASIGTVSRAWIERATGVPLSGGWDVEDFRIRRNDPVPETVPGAPVIPNDRIRFELDAQLLHAHYFDLRRRESEAASEVTRIQVGLGPHLEVLDPASLPVSLDIDWWYPALPWGATAGLSLGLLLLVIPYVRRIRLRQAAFALLCCLTGLTCTAVAVTFTRCHPYKSSAVVRGVFFEKADEERFTLVTTRLLANFNLFNLITTNGLFSDVRARQPLEDVIALTRSKIGIQRVSEARPQPAAWEIVFDYWGPNRPGEPANAQKATADLVRRVIDDFARLQAEQSRTTNLFLEGEANRLADAWSRTRRATGPNPDRLALEANLARSRYIENYKLLIKAKENRPFDRPVLELLDPALLPKDATLLDSILYASTGLIGLLIGLIWKRPSLGNPAAG